MSPCAWVEPFFPLMVPLLVILMITMACTCNPNHPSPNPPLREHNVQKST